MPPPLLQELHSEAGRTQDRVFLGIHWDGIFHECADTGRRLGAVLIKQISPSSFHTRHSLSFGVCMLKNRKCAPGCEAGTLFLGDAALDNDFVSPYYPTGTDVLLVGSPDNNGSTYYTAALQVCVFACLSAKRNASTPQIYLYV